MDEDDLILAQSEEATWFKVLSQLDWRPYRELGVKYYSALYDFNLNRRQAMRQDEEGSASETQQEAKQRLLFERPTMEGNETPILFEPEYRTYKATIDAKDVAPGKVPIRMAGKDPKCFFSLFKAFLGVTMMARPPEPDTVHQELTNNPSFARACGFTPSRKGRPYRQSDVPSLRKLQQFDQIMAEYGLWDQCKWDEVNRNLSSGLIHPEAELVHDTSHWEAFSGFEVVEYEHPKGKAQKKSQSKTTKRCHCRQKDTCDHPWILNDDGAGTVVKSSGTYWAHKASILVLPRQGIPLDAVALVDAANHDSKTLIPHLGRLFEKLPSISPWFTHVLDDSAANDHELITSVYEDFELTLRASINPRRRKPILENLPRGMAKLTPYGELICLAGHSLHYRGVRWKTEHFIYGPPLDDDGWAHCLTCPHKPLCCPRSQCGRHATISFDLLPHIRQGDPPMAKRLKAMMTLRPAVERVIKLLKFDMASKDLTKRGNLTFQARLDKSLIALHILLRQ